jgi:lysozyme
MAWAMMGLLLLACSGVSGRSTLGEPSAEGTGCTAEPLEQCASQGVEGIDVFDGQGAVDWQAVADAGIAFAMIKATQGTYDTQSTFAANWQGSRRSGVRRGAYHFFDPTGDGAAQAAQFLAAVGALEPGDLPPMLDLECPDGDPDCLGTGAGGSAPAGAIAVRVWDWIHAVEAATGTRPIVYTYGGYFASSGVDPAGLEAYPLFLAQPSTASTARPACFNVPTPWSRATMWQYSWSGTVPGIGVPVDRDRFLGSLAELDALAVGRPATGGLDGGPVGSDGAAGAVPEAGQPGAGPGPPGCF